jgi:hypothetical protein
MFTVYIAKATANLVFQLPDPSMNVPWKVRYLPYYGVESTSDIIPVLPDRQTAEICLRFATLERKGKSTELMQSTPTLQNSVIPESTLLCSGANGTLSRSRQGRRTHSERCCGSNEVCNLNSIRRLAISLHRPLLLGRAHCRTQKAM